MHQGIVKDVRDIVFSSIMYKRITAQITVQGDGIISGVKSAGEKLRELGVEVEFYVTDGDRVKAGDIVSKIIGTPKQITSAEDMAIGKMAKASGIATATSRAVELSEGKIRIVSGAWKKMPGEIKEMVREAVKNGGASFRIVDTPFMYLDKNYVRIFGGIVETLKATKELGNICRVIQLRGETKSIREEAAEAISEGADVLMIDTGNIQDAVEVINLLNEMGIRQEKKVAFAGEIRISDIPLYSSMNIDILDIGKQIVDAPLLDMKLDVV